MKKTLSIVLFVLLVFLAVACSPETHKHDYKLVEEKSFDATCTCQGLEYYECAGCGDIKSVFTAYVDHDYEFSSTEEEANCVDKGKDVYKCKNCGKTEERDTPVDSTNHKTPTNKTTVLAATCAADGESTVDCSACGAKGVKQVEKKLTTSHVKLNSSKTSTTPIAKSDITNYKTTRKATAFVKEIKEAVCPTCGGTIDSICEYGDYNDKLLSGTWKFRSGADEENYIEYFVTVKYDESGAMSVEAYTQTTTSGTTAAPEELTLTVKDFSINAEGNGSRVLKVNGGSAPYIEIGEYTETDPADSPKYQDGDNFATVGTGDGGNETREKTFIDPVDTEHTQHAWTRVAGSKVFDEKHTVECETCGLGAVEKTHVRRSCDICGRDTSDWYSVIVTFDTDKDADDSGFETDTAYKTFYLKKTETFKLPVAVKYTTSQTWNEYSSNYNSKTSKTYYSALVDANGSYSNGVVSLVSGKESISIRLGGKSST